MPRNPDTRDEYSEREVQVLAPERTPMEHFIVKKVLNLCALMAMFCIACAVPKIIQDHESVLGLGLRVAYLQMADRHPAEMVIVTDVLTSVYRGSEVKDLKALVATEIRNLRVSDEVKDLVTQLANVIVDEIDLYVKNHKVIPADVDALIHRTLKRVLGL